MFYDVLLRKYGAKFLKTLHRISITYRSDIPKFEYWVCPELALLPQATYIPLQAPSASGTNSVAKFRADVSSK